MIELLRRWPSLIFMVLMPLGYFLATWFASDAETVVPLPVGEGAVVDVLDRDAKSVYLAVLGIGVTASFAAMTLVRPGGTALRRLRLIGYAAWHLLVARLVVLVLISALSTAVFCAFFLPLVSVAAPMAAVLALALVGLTGISLGATVGLLVPREFEAAMILIAFAGMQMALGRGGSSAEQYLPYWPSLDALQRATFVGGDIAGPALQALAYIAALLLLSLGLWSWRTRVWPPKQA